METDTRIFKERDGWKALSQIEMDDVFVLKIRTARIASGDLVTSASVWQKQAQTGLLSHTMGNGKPGDYQQKLTQSRPARVTESLVTRQHRSVLAGLETIQVNARAYYASLPGAMCGGDHVHG